MGSRWGRHSIEPPDRRRSCTSGLGQTETVCLTFRERPPSKVMDIAGDESHLETNDLSDETYTKVCHAQSPKMTRAHGGHMTLWTRCQLVIAAEA